MNKIVKKVFDNVMIDDEAKKALLCNHNWIGCVIRQIENRLPNENTDKHLTNVCVNIANYSNNNYPYPGYYDIINEPNTTAIKVATKYIDYVANDNNIDYEDIYDNINDYEYPYNHINRSDLV